MLDDYNAALMRELRTLYRARPFTKAIPFSLALPVANTEEVRDLWVPQNAYFEIGLVTIRCSVAGVDLSLCDTNWQNPFLFVMAPTTEYQTISLIPGYRSLLSSGAKVVVNNPALTVATIKGVLFGWEVTQDGYYR